MNKWYRIVQIAYVTGVENEDGPGSLQNPVQHTSRRVTHALSYAGDAEHLDAETVSLYADVYPVRDYDDAFGPAVGDSDYSYELQVKGEDGKWTLVKYLDPVDSKDDGPFDGLCSICDGPHDREACPDANLREWFLDWDDQTGQVVVTDLSDG